MLLKSAFCVGACFLCFFSSSAFALDFKPGNYEITSTVEMPGMPAGMIPSQTITQCVTEQDPIPKNDVDNQECTISDMQETNNQVTWNMECMQEGNKITSKGQISYAKDSFDGTISMNMGPQSGNMSVITKIKGKRLGDCQKSE